MYSYLQYCRDTPYCVSADLHPMETKIEQLQKRMRRFDLLDLGLLKLFWGIIGIVIGTYFAGLRGFVEQNLWVVVFLILALGARPIVRYFR